MDISISIRSLRGLGSSLFKGYMGFQKRLDVREWGFDLVWGCWVSAC